MVGSEQVSGNQRAGLASQSEPSRFNEPGAAPEQSAPVMMRQPVIFMRARRNQMKRGC